MFKISGHFQSVNIHALICPYKFQIVLMSPFGDIDNYIFWVP